MWTWGELGMLQWECKRKEISFCFQSKLFELKVELWGKLESLCHNNGMERRSGHWVRVTWTGLGPRHRIGCQMELRGRHRPGGKGAVAMSRDQAQTVSGKPSHSWLLSSFIPHMLSIRKSCSTCNMYPKSHHFFLPPQLPPCSQPPASLTCHYRPLFGPPCCYPCYLQSISSTAAGAVHNVSQIMWLLCSDSPISCNIKATPWDGL